MIRIARAVAPYAERAFPATTKFDRAVASAIGTALPYLPGQLRRFRALARRIHEEGAALEGLSEAGLLEAAAAVRPHLLRTGARPSAAVCPFALVREAARRHLGIRHHEVQL